MQFQFYCMCMWGMLIEMSLYITSLFYYKNPIFANSFLPRSFNLYGGSLRFPHHLCFITESKWNYTKLKLCKAYIKFFD